MRARLSLRLLGVLVATLALLPGARAQDSTAVAPPPVEGRTPRPLVDVTAGAMLGGSIRGARIGVAFPIYQEGLFILRAGFDLIVLQLVDAETDDALGAYLGGEPHLSGLLRLGRLPLALSADAHLAFGSVLGGEEHENGQGEYVVGARVGAYLLVYPLRAGPVLGVGHYTGSYSGSDRYVRETGVQITVGWRIPLPAGARSL